MIIDAHLDLLMDVAIQREKGRRKVIETNYWLRFNEGGVNIIIAAIFIDSGFLPEMGLRNAELGVRNLGLVWSRRNAVGDGSHFSPIDEGTKGGITTFEVKVIEEAEKLGMMIDVELLSCCLLLSDIFAFQIFMMKNSPNYP